MKCPECQFENREGAKFCNECGHKFDITCSECNASKKVGSKFCDECGYKLTSTPTTISQNLSFDEKLAKLQKYLPKGLTEKILSQRDIIEGERKQVTVMFGDMEDGCPPLFSLGQALSGHNSENTPTLELLKLIHHFLQTRKLVDRSFPYPRRFGNVSDIAGMNVTSINAINIAR